MPVPPPTDLLHLRVESPFRPPDYRWRLAHRLTAGAWVPDGWADRWVRLAAELLTAPPERAFDAPDRMAAAEARELAAGAPSWRRVGVEARLLAGVPAAEVGHKAGLPAAAVAAYAALFFSVADRLGAPGYVVGQVIRAHDPGADADPAVHVRLLSFFGGPLVADALLDAFAGPDPGDDAPADVRRVRTLARLAVGLRVTPATPENALRWVRLVELMRECRAAGMTPG